MKHDSERLKKKSYAWNDDNENAVTFKWKWAKK